MRMISFHWILIITIIQIGFYSLGIEQNFNIFESNLLNIIPDEVAWNTGGKTGITEKDSKSIFCQKFIIDKLQYSEKEINAIIEKMNINDNNKIKLYLELNSKDDVIEEIKYQLNLKIRIRKKINNKILLKLKRGRKKKMFIQTQIIINILQII